MILGVRTLKDTKLDEAVRRVLRIPECFGGQCLENIRLSHAGYRLSVYCWGAKYPLRARTCRSFLSEEISIER
jgi:hypothetical protein